MSIRLHSRSISRVEWNICTGGEETEAIFRFLKNHGEELALWIDEAEERIEIQNPEGLPRLVHLTSLPDEAKAFLLGCYENSKRTGGIAYLDAF